MIRKTKKAAIKTHQWLTAKRIHWLVYGVAVVWVASVFSQLVFPSDYTLPGARIDQLSVGNQQRMQLIETLHTSYDSTQISLDIPGQKPQQVSLGSTGYVPKYNEAADSVLDYPVWQRFIPFSAVYHLLTHRSYVPQEIDSEVFSEFARRVSEICKKTPQDAAIQIKDGQVSLKPAVAGQQCDNEQLRLQLQAFQLGQTELKVIASEVAPHIPDGQLRTQFMQAKQVVETDIILGSPGEQWKVPRETVAKWLTVTVNGEQVDLSIDREAVKQYLSKYRGKTYIAPGITTVHLLDGLEIRRETGVNGQGIDARVTSARIADSLLKPSIPKVIWTQLAVLPAAVSYDRQYSQSNVGLQALIEQWDRDNAGRYGIIVRDLSGRGLNAQLYADRDFVTASTYKQFLAYAVMHKIESGQMSFDDQTSTGLTVRGCIDEMILHSTNPCAVALQDKAGWSYVHSFIRGQFPSTSLDNGASADDEKHSTVRDEVTFQTRLNAGTLQMNAGNHAYLLGLLKRQVYRGGIPAGVPGVTVANKVGFYDGYKHDIAIIYGPKGAYQLGVMSYGGADWRFADLSRRVSQLMNR